MCTYAYIEKKDQFYPKTKFKEVTEKIESTIQIFWGDTACI